MEAEVGSRKPHNGQSTDHTSYSLPVQRAQKEKQDPYKGMGKDPKDASYTGYI